MPSLTRTPFWSRTAGRSRAGSSAPFTGWVCVRSPSSPTLIAPRPTSARPTTPSASAPRRPAIPTCARTLIIDAALSTGAGIIHPGYGFLSESAVSPELSEAAGHPVRGTYRGADRRVRRETHRPCAGRVRWRAAARRHRVAVERRRGCRGCRRDRLPGDGQGHRRRRWHRNAACATADEVAAAFERVAALAAANFGTTGVFLERLVRPARHVEVQVFGDGAGRMAVVGDRDCSLQRRNQKVIEEAPAPGAARPRPRTAAHVRARAAGLGELPQRGNRRVRLRPPPGGSGVPRGEHPPSGRASGHRGGVRR